MKPGRVAIIGAGLAGLTAAWRLREHGVEPVVFERTQHVGGRSYSTGSKEGVFDRGAWAFPLESPVHDFALELGLGDELIDITPTVGRPRRGRILVGDPRKPLSLPGTILSYMEIGAARKLLRAAQDLPGCATDETAGSWAGRNFAKPFIEDLLAPLARLFYLQELDTLSRDCLLETIGYLSTARLRGFRSGMGVLALFLADGASVMQWAEVREIRPAGDDSADGLEVLGEDFDAAVDAVIVATPLPRALRLIGKFLPSRAREAALAWPYAPMVAAQLMTMERFEKTPLLMLPARGLSRVASGLTIERGKHPWRVEGLGEVVTLYARPDRVEDFMRMSDEEVGRAFSAELRHWLGMGERPVETVAVSRWNNAAACCDPDAPYRLADLMMGLNEMAQSFPIWAAGDYLGDSSLSGAVVSGEKAAGACIKYLERRRGEPSRGCGKARRG